MARGYRLLVSRAEKRGKAASLAFSLRREKKEREGWAAAEFSIKEEGKAIKEFVNLLKKPAAHGRRSDTTNSAKGKKKGRCQFPKSPARKRKDRILMCSNHDTRFEKGGTSSEGKKEKGKMKQRKAVKERSGSENYNFHGAFSRGQRNTLLTDNGPKKRGKEKSKKRIGHSLVVSPVERGREGLTEESLESQKSHFSTNGKVTVRDQKEEKGGGFLGGGGGGGGGRVLWFGGKKKKDGGRCWHTGTQPSNFTSPVEARERKTLPQAIADCRKRKDSASNSANYEVRTTYYFCLVSISKKRKKNLLFS